MNKVIVHILIFPFLSLFCASLCFAEVSIIGEYNIQFNLGNFDLSSNVILSDVALSINLPKGEGTVHIPLPISKTPDLKSIIEPNSSNNLVLLGILRPNTQYTVIQISLLEVPSNIYILFRNVKLPLQESSRSDSGRSACILLNQAYNEVEAILNNFHAPRLNEIFIRTANFQSSEPKAEMCGVYPQKKIKIDESQKTPPDIYVFLSMSQNQYFLYIVLGIMGILLGYFAAPKIISTSSKAKWFLLTSVVGLIAIAVVFFGLLSPEQRFADTTTIVTIGTLCGLLLGLFIASIQFLFTYQRMEP